MEVRKQLLDSILNRSAAQGPLVLSLQRISHSLDTDNLRVGVNAGMPVCCRHQTGMQLLLMAQVRPPIACGGLWCSLMKTADAVGLARLGVLPVTQARNRSAGAGCVMSACLALSLAACLTSRAAAQTCGQAAFQDIKLTLSPNTARERWALWFLMSWASSSNTRHQITLPHVEGNSQSPDQSLSVRSSCGANLQSIAVEPKHTEHDSLRTCTAVLTAEHGQRSFPPHVGTDKQHHHCPNVVVPMWQWLHEYNAHEKTDKAYLKQ